MPDKQAPNSDGAASKAEEKKPPVDTDKYFLVIVGDSSEEAPRTIECDSLKAFAAAVNESVLGAENVIHAFGFKGQRVSISAPTPVCAVEINGKRAEVGSEDRTFDPSGRITPLRR